MLWGGGFDGSGSMDLVRWIWFDGSGSMDLVRWILGKTDLALQEGQRFIQGTERSLKPHPCSEEHGKRVLDWIRRLSGYAGGMAGLSCPGSSLVK